MYVCVYVCMYNRNSPLIKKRSFKLYYLFFVESFTLAAAAILDASSTFSASRRATMTPQREVQKDSQKSNKPQRAHTFSKNQIDSTPRMVTKFDKPYLER